jgi:hypothetical protein
MMAALLALGGLAATAPAADALTLGGHGSDHVTVELTGYSWYDNTPANSSRICCGAIHRHAGGTGTYSDPITVAVPGTGASMQYPPGTRFYSPKLNRYLVVEDSGASHTSHPHLDVWVDGQGLPRRYSDRCMNDLTGTTTVIIHPKPGMHVTSGPLTSTTGDACRT